MEFAEVIRRRRMVRHYSDRPLAPEAIERVLASAVRAPSAGFSQGWAFLALTEPADRARFWPFVPTRVAQTPTMLDAPLVVVPMAHKATYLQRYAEPDKGWEDRAEARWPPLMFRRRVPGRPNVVAASPRLSIEDSGANTR